MCFVIPFSGTVKPIKDVPDPIFSEKMMGDGFVIDIDDNIVVSPTSGVVKTIFPTGHAIVIETYDGFQYLIHLGLDTHKLSNVFQVVVKKDEVVKVGQRLIKVKLKKFKKLSSSTLCPIVFLTGEKVISLKEGYYNRLENNFIEFGKD